MRARAFVLSLAVALDALATPRFAARKEGPVACECAPTRARALPRAAGRALVVAADAGPLTVLGAPVAGPTAALRLGGPSLRPGALVTLDVDLDGAIDLFVPSAVDGAAPALFVARGASFVDEAAARLPQLAGGARAATWGDLDGDGFAELVVAREDSLELLLNDGAGRFTRGEASRLPAADDATPKGAGVFDVLALDLDQDLDLDLVVLRAHGRGRVLLNDGKGAFTERAGGVPSTGAATTSAVDFADLDGSGALDLVLTGAPIAGGSPLAQLLGPALDQARYAVDAPTEDAGVRTVDATADGVLDVVALSRVAPGPRLLVSTSSGARAEPDAFGAWGGGAPPRVFDVGDFDGDGAPDVLGARTDGTSFFYRGLPQLDAPPRPARSLRQGGVTRRAPGEPVTTLLALRDVTRASSEAPLSRVELTATVADAPITPLYVRHVGGDLVRVELPALREGDTLHLELHLPDSRGDDLVVGPIDVPIGGDGQAASEPPAAPGEPPAPAPPDPSAWSCGARGRVGDGWLAALGAIALGAWRRSARGCPPAPRRRSRNARRA